MTAPLPALLFDGRSAAGRPVTLRVDGSELLAEGEVTLRWPLAQVRWPERTRHGQRVLHVASGETLQCADAAAFDAWAAALGRHDSWIVRAQQNWRLTLSAVGALVLVLAAGYLWGVPLAARAVVALVPQTLDRRVGDTVLKSLDERKLLKPSTLPAARQQVLRDAFARAEARAEVRARGGGSAVAHRIEFRSATEANAFALPGGTIVITDELVQLLADREDTLLGVMAHELGHVRGRHGMRLLVQATLVGAGVAMVIGDFSTLLAGAPVLLAQLSYARDFEREADAEAAHLLRAAGYAPAAMVVFFERVQDQAERSVLPLGLASHPGHEERARYFREVPQR